MVNGTVAEVKQHRAGRGTKAFQKEGAALVESASLGRVWRTKSKCGEGPGEKGVKEVSGSYAFVVHIEKVYSKQCSKEGNEIVKM